MNANTDTGGITVKKVAPLMKTEHLFRELLKTSLSLVLCCSGSNPASDAPGNMPLLVMLLEILQC